MRVAHLFSGAGGGLLADLILGHTPVLAVEQNEFCCAVLQERKDDGWFPDLHIHCGDIQKFDFTPWARRLDCIAAGFPCQDISCAGKGAGLAGQRSGLVWEVFRAIDEIKPAYVFLENSPQIRTKGRSEITAALVERGYRWKDGKIAASDVGAGHLRQRWFLLATNIDQIDGNLGGFYPGAIPQQYTPGLSGRKVNADIVRSKPQTGRRQQSGPRIKTRRNLALSPQKTAHALRYRSQRQRRHSAHGTGQKAATHCSSSPADIMQHRLQSAIQRGGLSAADAETIEAVAGYTTTHHWSPPDTGICGMVDGLADRAHRIKALGNGQVPLQAAAAFLILMGN